MAATQQLWRPRPFAEPDVQWRELLPATASWLSGLSLDAIDRFDRWSALPLEAPGEMREVACRLRTLTASLEGDLDAAPVDLPERLRWRVPHRKWTQIEALTAVAKAGTTGGASGEVVDWCAGKGHLGRALALCTGRKVRHLELRPELCRAGEALAVRAGIAEATTFVQGSVLAPAVVRNLAPDSVVVALHACGSLSSKLVASALQRRVGAVVLSTCCYHKLMPGQDVYEPLSRAGRAVGLQLDKAALRLPTADERNAGRRDILRRRRELAWRQGTQQVLAETTGDPTYRALGPFRPSDFRRSFADFVGFVLDRMDVPLPRRGLTMLDERAGWERARRVRGLALLRGLFRRPMEAWLIGDHALALQDGGYDVRVGRFCESATTPRNLAIVARRPPSTHR